MSEQGLGRRDFLKGAVIGGAAAATPHLSEQCRRNLNQRQQNRLRPLTPS